MALLLMCKNHEVYNIDTEEIYNKDLLPGLMVANGANKETFKKWFELRYSSKTNSSARKLREIAFGKSNRATIDKTTRALSLSDCYWIKQSYDYILFEHVSPYYKNFWSGNGDYKGESIPTLYVDGYMNKEWVDSYTLIKYGNTASVEYAAIELCRVCRLHVMSAKLLSDNAIAVRNMTNMNIMLETAEESGKFDEDRLTDNDIVTEFGLKGFQMIVIDAITGNGDRHLGNFGYFRDCDMGVYLGMAPMYDFDHALDAKGTDDRLLRSAVEIACSNEVFWKECKRICETSIRYSTHEIFKNRAKSLYRMIQR